MCSGKITKYNFQQGVPDEILNPNFLLCSLPDIQILSGSLTRTTLNHRFFWPLGSNAGQIIISVF